MSILEPLLSLGQAIDHEQVIEWVREFGGIILFLFAFAEVVPPVSFLSPGGLVLIASGAVIDDPATAASFFGAAWLGFILGNALFFWLGRRYGRAIAHHLWLTEQRLQYVDDFIARYGRISVFLGQFAGGVRPFIAFIAGAAREGTKEFFLSMIVGSAIWGGMLLTAGFFFRNHLKYLLSGLGVMSVLLFFGLLFFFTKAEQKLLGEKEENTPST